MTENILSIFKGSGSSYKNILTDGIYFSTDISESVSMVNQDKLEINTKPIRLDTVCLTSSVKLYIKKKFLSNIYIIIFNILVMNNGIAYDNYGLKVTVKYNDNIGAIKNIHTNFKYEHTICAFFGKVMGNKIIVDSKYSTKISEIELFIHLRTS